MDTIADLIATIDRLPIEERAEAVAALEDILEMREGPRELALGLLALDLAPHAATARPAASARRLVSA